jgi:cytochrome c553
MKLRTGALLAGLLATSMTSLAQTAEDPLVEQGRRIYVDGVLPSGEALQAVRAGGVKAAGGAVACVNCHRKSGMGEVEGDLQVRPITGNYLFHIGHKNMATMDPRIGKRMNQAHEAYTDATLARAIREGINSNGTQMNELMPRFELADADMQALQAYLKQLSHAWSPGVTDKTIRFATVVAPGVDPARRKVFLDMLQAAVAQKNGSTAPGHRHMVSPAEMLGVTERTWILDVWELSGPPQTWGAQLDAYYQKAPVFALISGLSETTWAPVAEFCERNRIPDWFPSVDLAPAPGQYTLYFSRGVAMEAEVLAKMLRSGGNKPQRLVQVFRDDDVGRGAAAALSKAMDGSGIVVEDRALGAGTSPARALDGLNVRQDAVMLWLPGADLAKLAQASPPKLPLYASGRLLRDAVPQGAWRTSLRLIYPYQLPERRDANLAMFHTWMDVRRFAKVDEAMQDEAFFALSYLTLTISEMLDNLYRDYLIERSENMLSLQEKTRSVDETRMRAVAGHPGAMIEHYGAQTSPEGIHRETLDRMTSVKNEQTGTSIYPHLSLGAGQRFASKGAYVVRFDGSGKMVADSDWIVP